MYAGMGDCKTKNNETSQIKVFLWGDHLASLDIVCMKENVIARNKVARWASDLQNLVPNARKTRKENDLLCTKIDLYFF